MVRDELITLLVRHEPITPFVSRVRELYETHGVSTIVVVGGTGQYLHVADTVIVMEKFHALDRTDDTAVILANNPGLCRLPPRPSAPMTLPPPRTVNLAASFANLTDRVKATRDAIAFGTETVDVTGLEQLVERSQATYIAQALCHALSALGSTPVTVPHIATLLLGAPNMDHATSSYTQRFPVGFSTRVRPLEIAAALNRLRSLRIR